MSICMYVCMYTHTHTHKTHKNKHTHTRTHTHTADRVVFMQTYSTHSDALKSQMD
jgi:hypothetical protein